MDSGEKTQLAHILCENSHLEGEDKLNWMQEEVREVQQEWKEVEQLEAMIFQEQKEKRIAQFQTMTAVVASQIKSQQDEVQEKKEKSV